MHIDWTALGTWATFFATIAIGAFVYGRTTEKVAKHDEEFGVVHKLLDSHATDIRSLRDDMVRVKTHLSLD